MPTFNIYIPSYRRSDRIMTHNLVEYSTYIVRKSEEELYKAKGVNVLAVEDSLIVGIPAVQNWLIENAPEDVICILDDDLTHFFYRTDVTQKLGEDDKETITAEIERLAQLAYDLEIGHVVTTRKGDPKSYTRPFSFSGIQGTLKIINRAKCKSRFCEIDFLNDVDFMLQELMRNRIILLSEYFSDVNIMDVNAGGSNVTKSAARFHVAVEQMKLKWGKYYEPAVGTERVGRIKVVR